MEAKIRYDGDDGGREDGSLSLDEDEHGGGNYMSLDESYSGNVGGDNDNDDMDVDDSYAENGTHMDVEGYYEWNLFDDANDENDVDASYNDNSSKGDVGDPCENDDDANGDE
ncbi:prostatic spermine-binding protein-like isoform X2 [Triticum aestivum]|uniref:prostatic spermine-binding protein-like isoform X2 n=1 Tax=Triticum aestivum TaxID=4565 RepID=UPI001D007195|nr:prostatic spermine-binding protein-like isoform X2 [Triticum aestivum]